MKRSFFVLLLTLSCTALFAQGNRHYRWNNEYMGFAWGSYGNPVTNVEDWYIVLFNYTQDTDFETRILINELGVDTTVMVTPEGYMDIPQHFPFPGETWIRVGQFPASGNPKDYPQVHVSVFARSEKMQFHLSDTWFSNRR